MSCIDHMVDGACHECKIEQLQQENKDLWERISKYEGAIGAIAVHLDNRNYDLAQREYERICSVMDKLEKGGE